MNKPVSILLSSLFVVPVFFSCMEKEQELVPAQERETIPVEVTRYEYRFEIGEGESRAFLNDDGVFWENSDQVGVFVGTGSAAATDVNVETNPKTIVLSTGSPIPSGTDIYAYYPYHQGDGAASSATICFPHDQQGGSVSAMPMAGVPVQLKEDSSNGVIRFKNLGTIIDFRVFSATRAGDEHVKSIRMSTTAGTNPLTGVASLDLAGVDPQDESTLTVSWPEGASIASSVTLSQAADVAASVDLAAQEHLYMVIAPGTYSGTIAVVTDAATYTYSFTDMEFPRNSLRRFNMNLDSGNARRDERAGWYQKISLASELTDGDEYLIVYEGGSEPLAFKPILNGSQLDATTNNKKAVTVENDRIKSTEVVDEYRVVLETAPQSKYYMKAVAVGDYYFYPNGSNITATLNKNSATSVTIGFKGVGVVNITAGSNNYFKYSTSSQCFKGSTYDSSRNLALYKKVNSEGISEQYLRFSAPFFAYCINGQNLPAGNVPNVPVLTGAYTEVTYSSSNGNVASVDASTGALTIQGEGSAVITASAAADADFNAGSASYSVTVQQEPVFNLENDAVNTYLNLVDAQPYSPPDYSTTHMTAELQSGNTDRVNRTDWPKPVPVNWSNPSVGNVAKTVYVYNDAGMTLEELHVDVDSDATGVEVYNLIPNRTYFYKVSNGNDELTRGSFSTTGRRRMIKVGDSPYGKAYANNCRDFGGQITKDGRRIKYGKLFRGSNMDKTTDVQKGVLRNYMHIGLDVDLRTTGNDQGQGENSLFDALGLDSQGGHTSETFNSWDDFSKKYNGVYKMTTILSKIFAAVNANKGVYIHCMVGADRTGYTCMLLEAILGVEQGWCDVDYELTSFSGAVDDGIGRWRIGYVSGKSNNWYYRTRNNTVQGVDYIYNLSEGDYGTVYPNNPFQAKAVNYVVKTLGIPYTDVQAFQNNMLEDNN